MTSEQHFRRVLPALVCLLVLGVAMLAMRAKASQYHSEASFSCHLCKSTKMSDERPQKSVPARVPAPTPLYQAEAPREYICIEPQGAAPVLVSLFAVPWFRPPPAPAA